MNRRQHDASLGEREIEAALHAEWVAAVGRPRWRLWFRDVAVVGFDGETLQLGVPSDLHRAWMEVAYGALVERAACHVLGAGVRVRVVPTDAQAELHAVRSRLPENGPAWDALLAVKRPVPCFATFVGGADARFAAHCLERLAAEPKGRGSGPTLLVGDAATGKSHLLAATEAVAQRRAPGSTMRIDAGEWTERYVATLRARDDDARRAFEQSIMDRDLVLLDDVHHLAGRPATQEQLARLIDRSVGSRPAWVVASAQHPREIEGMLPRLASRLESGCVLTLAPPNEAERLALLVRRGEAYGLAVPQEVAEAVLQRCCGLAGAVSLFDRWAVASIQWGSTLDPAWLDEVAPTPSRTPSDEVVGRVKRAVAAHFGIEPAQLERPSKARALAWPRQVAIYLVYRACALSLVNVGVAFGLRSHSSVSRAIDEMRARRSADASVEVLLDGLLASL